MVRFRDEMATRLTQSHFVLPANTLDAVRAWPAVDTQRCWFWTDSHRYLLEDPPRSLDLTRMLPGIVNVVPVALMLAMHLGCSPIYLLGCDHTFLANVGELSHFYQGATITGSRRAHQINLERGYLGAIREAQTLWRSYIGLHRYAQSRSIEIINATPGGLLDVFPRADFNQVIAPPARAVEQGPAKGRNGCVNPPA